MSKNYDNIIISLTSLLVGLIIALLMKNKVEFYAPVTLKSIQNTKDELKAVSEELEELKVLYEHKKEEFSIIENISKSEEDIIDMLLINRDENKLQSGFASMEGPGISIKMYDNPTKRAEGFDINMDLIHDVDILNILNDLRIAGAEAISINGEMVLSTSEIKCGGPIIVINDKSFATPFIIEAIGDPKVLLASVNAPGTYGDTLKNVYGIVFESKVEDKVHIKGYEGEAGFLYAKPKGEGGI